MRIVEDVSLLAFWVWLIAVRPRMRRRCEGEGADDGEYYGLHVFLHCEPSVRLFDVNFDFHFACALEGKDEREVLVAIEGFSESQQENVRPIWSEFDRSDGRDRDSRNVPFAFRFSVASLPF